MSARLSSADPFPLLNLCQSLPRAEMLFWTGTGEPSIRSSTEAYLRTSFACLDSEKNENVSSNAVVKTASGAHGARGDGGGAASATPSTAIKALNQSRVGFDVARGGNLWLEAQVTTWRYLKWGQAWLVGL